MGEHTDWRLVCLALITAAGGCSADPSLLTDGRGGDPRRSQNANEPAAGGATGPSAGASDAGAIDDGRADASATSDAGADASVDASTDGAPLVNAFTGAPAFVATTGPSARKDAHAFADNTPITSPAKQPCLDCHVAGGAAPAFAFGGTAFTDVAGTLPAANVEIRVRAPSGSAVSVYTDEDGNFYAPAAFAFPANAGVRSAVASRVMNGPAPQGNCNGGQCHGGGTHPWIHLP